MSIAKIAREVGGVTAARDLQMEFIVRGDTWCHSSAPVRSPPLAWGSPSTKVHLSPTLSCSSLLKAAVWKMSRVATPAMLPPNLPPTRLGCQEDKRSQTYGS